MVLNLSIDSMLLRSKTLTGVVKVKHCNLEIPTNEDIQDALKVSDPLEKALVLAGVSSGLAANEIVNLKFCDYYLM